RCVVCARHAQSVSLGRAAFQPGERRRRATRSRRAEYQEGQGADRRLAALEQGDGEATLGARRWWKGTGRRMTQRFGVLLGLLLASACARPEAQQPYDVVITGGSVLNGEGTPAVRADVGIRGGRIAAIGDLGNAAAAGRIDCNGLTRA